MSTGRSACPPRAAHVYHPHLSGSGPPTRDTSGWPRTFPEGTAPGVSDRIVLKEIATGLLVTLVVVVVAEVFLRLTYFVRNAAVTEIPLPYMVGDDYGPIPPWVDGLRILEPDETFIWRARPSVRRRYIDVFSPAQNEDERTALVRRFLPTVPDALRNNPVWEIALNSHGFRDAEFPREKRPSTFRIVCLGDSWTFGANVGQDQAYPQRLKALLRREFPSADFEVFNLGVL